MAARRIAEPTPLANAPEPSLGWQPTQRAAIRPSSGEQPTAERTLSLAELEAIAREQNPTFAQASALLDRARARQRHVGRWPNPHVGYHAEEIGAGGSAGHQGGFVALTFVTADKLNLNRAVAEQDIHRAELQREAQAARVLNDLRARFVEVLAAQEAIRLAGELERIAGDGVTTTQRLADLEQGPKTDVLQAQIELQRARLETEAARHRLVGAWRRLVLLVGRPELTLHRLRATLDEPRPLITWESAAQRLLAENPTLGAARAELARARAVLAREQAERRPDIESRVSVQHDTLMGDMMTGVEVGIMLPLYANQDAIDAAAAAVRRAEAEITRLELSLRDRLADVFRRYELARWQVERDRCDLLPTVERNLKLTTDGHKLGEFDFLRVLVAQRTAFEVRRSHVEALAELRAAEIALDGLLLTGGLDAVPE